MEQQIKLLIPSLVMPAAIAVSLAAALVTWLTRNSAPRLHNYLATGSAFVKFSLVLSLLPGIWRGRIYYCNVFTFIPQMEIAFRADGLGYLFALIASFFWVVTSLYSTKYMEEEKALPRYWTFLSVSMASTMGIAFAANLFTLFIFYESLTIATYPLIIHEQSQQAIKVGRKYLFYSLGGGTALMFSMIVTYYLTGHLDLGQRGILPAGASSSLLNLLFITYLIGFGTKSVLLPLHSWLPDSMIAPTPVSAILHAVAVVKAGVYGVLRTAVDIFGLPLLKEAQLHQWLLGIICLTILWGSVLAVFQKNLKRMLAYSTVSQLSYITLGVALATPSGITGGLLHMLYQSTMKITLFLCAGAIYRQTGITEINDMQGLGERIPLTMTAFTIAALGMIGIPGTAGFISKWYLAMGAIEANRLIIVAIIVISALLNALYYMPVIYKSFFQSTPGGHIVKQKSIPWRLVAPCIATAGLVLAFGISKWAHNLPLFFAQTIGNNLMGRTVFIH